MVGLIEETGCPILPIVVDGTSRALPKKGFVLQGRHDIEVRVLEEVPPESFADESVEALCARVRDRIAEVLDEKPAPAAANP